MERRRHIEAFSVVIGTFECDVFGSEIGADALEKSPEIHARPLADIVPTFDANVPDNKLVLREIIELLGAPGSFVPNEASQFELPSRFVDRLYLFDRIVGIEARWLDDLRLRKCQREMIRPEDELLDAVVPRGDCQQHRAYRRVIAHIAAGQKG